ncbi:Glycine-rich domain-containing protein [Actinidia chinensis var. chinensis]|uniref:Glycine-rich domain-containing protein n=1 Tax=Actinidia chinensis var. chinensis TaxID=1590841 RepID=A0A2R6QY51_ACTCC|nr:Glycine-rich domain-containing protein [Actinidia chinensis var. chinensis]
MEEHQELEWAAAQRILISQDLVAAAKQHLKFLAAVDRNRQLYDGPALDRAIYRYKHFWLPLLAKHTKSEFPDGPLVVPLDCEWIWHCHRINPVQYKMDCLGLYGRILDSQNVVSSVCGTSKQQTENLWNKMYPNEPFELSVCGYVKTVAENKVEASKSTCYDLVSAVKRQSSFYYQVSRPSTNNDRYLEAAVARYKGFLHLIKRNKENNTNLFLVPTYDIDLIWHSHQLHPVSYSKDLFAILGKILDHDDMDSDRTKGKKLDVGFCGTSKQWEETFGVRYWRAGAMYRGSPPTPLNISLDPLDSFSKKEVLDVGYQDMIQLPKKELVEVLLEIVGVRNLPDDHELSSLFVSLTKKQPDLFFKTSKKLNISPKSAEKHFTSFQCEPNGELLFELKSSRKTLGTTLVSLQDFFNPLSKLVMEDWFELVPTNCEISQFGPVGLLIALSFTSPIQAPYVIHMVQPCSSPKSPLFHNHERAYCAKNWTCVVDDVGNEVVSFQMRIPEKSQGRNNVISKKEVICMTRSGEARVLAEFVGQGWCLMSSQWFLQLQKKASEEEDLIGMLIGSKKVAIFQGRKLSYEIKNLEVKKTERDFSTLVEFSAESPYGKAVALLNLNSGFLKIEEEWLVLPGITLAFILGDILQKEKKTTNGAFEKATFMIGGGDEGKVESNFFSGWTGASASGSGGAFCLGGCCDDGGGCRSAFGKDSFVIGGGDRMVESNWSSGLTSADACGGSGGCGVGGGCGGSGCGGGCGGCGGGCGGGKCRGGCGGSK